MTTRNLKSLAWLTAIAAFLTGIAVSLGVGALSEFDLEVIRILRLPRTITAVAVGGGLAVAGTVMQASLNNPLADPYTMGIASVAALGAVVGRIAFRDAPLLGASSMAFLFAVGYLSALTIWMRSAFRESRELLLYGVISGFFFSSLAMLILALADPNYWSASFAWLLGSLTQTTISAAIVSLIVSVCFSFLIWLNWKPLDILSVDEDLAQTTGVNVAILRKQSFLLASVITAVCVATAGIIGFIGLIVPHAFRFFRISSHRLLLPLSFLGGAGLLTLSDAFSRVVARPSEVPVGIVMALIGGPAFLVLARSTLRRGS